MENKDPKPSKIMTFSSCIKTRTYKEPYIKIRSRRGKPEEGRPQRQNTITDIRLDCGEPKQTRMTGEPLLCIRGCGFFSTPQTKNLCSKCYNDFLKDETARYVASLKINTETATPEEVVVEKKKMEKSSSRCNACKKKVGLLGFHCKCSHVFCESHRYPEEHSCPWDYKTAGINDLAMQNPIVKADKLFRL